MKKSCSSEAITIPKKGIRKWGIRFLINFKVSKLPITTTNLRHLYLCVKYRIQCKRMNEKIQCETNNQVCFFRVLQSLLLGSSMFCPSKNCIGHNIMYCYFCSKMLRAEFPLSYLTINTNNTSAYISIIR